MKHSVELHQAHRGRFIPYAVLGIVLALLAQLPPTNDAAWQIWVGRQLLGGARLYRDIIEVNPPLWFWLTAPSSLLGWPGLLAFLGLSAALSISLVQQLQPEPWLPYALIFAFFLAGISATGQREQFTLIAVSPYVVLAAARAEDRRVDLRLAILIGLWAALGIALKHYFAVVPIALQVWLLLKRRPVAPEFLALCWAGALYLVMIVAVTPEYMRDIVPLVREAYPYYDRPLSFFATSDVAAVGLFAAVGLALMRRRDPLVQALALAGFLFLLIYAAQRKGFRYQGLPALGLLSLMAFVALVRLDYSAVRDKAAAVFLAFVPLGALATTAFFGQRVPAADYLCSLPKGTKVLALTPFGRGAWPAVETCGLQWSSRYMMLWTIASPRLREHTRRIILEDIARQPDVIVIEKWQDRIDPYALAMTDPRIVSALRSYRVVASNPKFVAYRRGSAKPTTA